MSDLSPTAARPTLLRRFSRLALLNVLANLTAPLTGLVDTAMLGHLDDIRFLAGVALASILFDYLYWSLGFLRMATVGLTAQAIGEQAAADDEVSRREARGAVYRVLYRSLILAIGIAALLVALQLPLAALGFTLLTGEAPVEAAGREYFFARIWGAPAGLANLAFLGWFLGREESGRLLAVSAVGNLANVALNYLFIIRLGMAARGAGLASALAPYLALAVALWFFAASGPPAAWRWRQLMERSKIARLAQLNGDLLLRSILLATCFAVFNNLSALAGTAVLAANTVLLRLFFVAAYLIDGVAYACESLAGIFRGARDRRSFDRLVRLAHAAGALVAIALIALLLAAPEAILGLLTSHREIVTLAESYLPWLAPVLLAGSAAFVYDGIFLGLAEGAALRRSMLIATLAVFVPAAGAALATGSIHLLWLALALFMAARAATLWWAGRRLFARS